MNVDRLLLILRIFVPIAMFGVAFILISVLTELHLGIVFIISVAIGLLDVFIIAPLTYKAADKIEID